MENFSSASKSASELLGAVPLLAKLSNDERSTLAKHLVSKTFKTDADIIKQYEEGDGFYIIQEGTVKIMRQKDPRDPSTVSQLATLKSGDYFGETALLSNATRGATVTATSPVTCLYLSREQFSSLFGSKRLNVQFAKRQAVCAEATNSSVKAYSPQMPADATKEKSPKTRQLILQAIKFNVLFMNLTPDVQNSVIDEMYRTKINKDVSAIRQGDLGDNLYVVESGEFHVFVNGNKVAVRNKGKCFGELALMYNSPRAATVTAVEDSYVWVVDRFTFRRVVTGVTKNKLNSFVNFLQNVDILSGLAEYEREKIAEALEEQTFEAGKVVCQQGAEGDALFIVHEGELVVTKKEGGSENEVGRCKVGDYFGERALIKNEPRAATVTCVGRCTLLRLDRNAFSLLLGPLEDIMQNKISDYDKKPAAAATTPATSSAAGTGKTQPNFEDLEVLGTLGKGSFGHVQLVKDKNTGTTYALKAVSKAQIVQTGQQGHIMSEKKAMAALNHPFLVPLHGTYKDKDRLYFLLEPSLGGELFSILREKTFFDEDTSRFYAGHVVLAFEYMHSLNYVYRDLKPENLLVDKDGYLKVTDFGFAKDISGGRTWTLCGTPDYLAPEIVAGKGHGKGVDWWTLGIFIYEMLASYPPFYDDDPMKTYAKIMHGSITFPSYFSKEAVSIVKKLLYPKMTKRLGVVKGGAKLIKKHAWFKGFSFEDLLAKKYKPAFVPKITSDTDISNFDDYGDDEDEGITPYVDDGSNWDADF